MEDYCLEVKTAVNFSVVVPVYNSAASLPELCEGIALCLHKHTFEIILVDDASKDESWKIIQQLQTYYPICSMQHSFNKGQSAGLLTGLGACNGDFVITLDDDLQFNPLDINHLIQKQSQTGADIVYGIPAKPKHSYWRKISSSCLKSLGRFAGFHSKGSSFRLLKKEVVLNLIKEDPDQNLLLDILFYRGPYSIATVEVPHYKRKFGRSNYSLLRLLFVLSNSLAAHCRFLFLKQLRK
jgi:polyisoprenyl-phosphate glycosyltransferase